MSDFSTRPEGAMSAAPAFDNGLTHQEFCDLMERALPVTRLMKILSHSRRMALLCHLAGGERKVTDLEELLGERQPWVSQQLMRLRQDGLVEGRREGREIYYHLSDSRTLRVLEVLYATFCEDLAVEGP